LQSIKAKNWRDMLAKQREAFALKNGLIANRWPGLNGQEALQILAYWWRQRGRQWTGWHEALKKLQESGLKADSSSLTKQLTEKQLIEVWITQHEAVSDLDALAPKSLPQVFSERQSLSDAKVMLTRFLTGNLTGKIPPLPKAPKPPPQPKIPKLPPKLPDKDKLPKVPRPPVLRPPALPGGKTLLLLLVLYLAAKE
jgi:hypothetical protein